MSVIDICRLCLTNDFESFIDIFGHQGIELNIKSTIYTHFQLEINNDDAFSTIICAQCWNNIETFNIYYQTILIAQTKIRTKRHSLIKPEIESIDELYAISSHSEILTIKNVKIEPIFNEQQNNDVLQEIDTIDEKHFEDHDYDEYENYHFNDEDPIDDHKIKTEISIKNESKETKKRKLPKSKLQNNKNSKIKKSRSNSIKKKQPSNVKRKSNDNNSIEFSANDETKDDAVDDSIIHRWCRMECELCLESFQRFIDVKLHYQNIHQEIGFVTCCKKKYIHRTTLMNHIAKHMNPNAFRCDICDKTFADKQCVISHMDKHVPLDDRNFHCDECDKKFARKFKLDQHKKIRHCKAEDKKFVCDQCGKGFAYSSSLRVHVRGVHMHANRHICDICAKVYNSKTCYDQHKLTEHSDIKLSKVQCTICHNWLKDKNSLRKHMTRHAQSTGNFTCNLCGKSAPNKDALQKHQRYSHYMEKVHQCSVCEKSFKKALLLKEHMTTHTGEILYTCPFCPKTFNSSANLHAHKKKQHVELWAQEHKSRPWQRRKDEMAINEDGS